MRFTFQQWLLKDNEFNDRLNKGKPIPMMIMVGGILKETEKSYFVEVRGKPENSTYCLHCGRKLTNKVSMFYGLGPICGKHYYITNITEANLESRFEEIRKKMNAIYWKGWIPKSSVTIEMEKLHKIIFRFKGQDYSIQTADETKVQEITKKSDGIIQDIIQEV